MRVKATLVLRALEKYFSNVVPKARHMRAETNTIILVHIKQDLDRWISPHKPVIKLGRGK